MSVIQIPEGYHPALSLYDTQSAIEKIKRTFIEKLADALNLTRVTAPLFVETGTGLNDNLNGTERAVAFDIPDAGTEAQVVHSLAKWKRMALGKYGFSCGEGLYTDLKGMVRNERNSDSGRISSCAFLI